MMIRKINASYVRQVAQNQPHAEEVRKSNMFSTEVMKIILTSILYIVKMVYFKVILKVGEELTWNYHDRKKVKQKV